MVHELARVGTELEAEVEKLFDEVLLSEIGHAPLITMEDVMEERRCKEERMKRIKERAQEVLQEELSKERQDQELRDLEAAAAALRDAPPSCSEGEEGKKADENPFTSIPQLPFKLQGVGRSKELKPYVANLSDFEPEEHVTRQLGSLRSENDMLQKCLQDSKNPRAFETYLRSKTTL